jgi:hypothetical protein
MWGRAETCADQWFLRLGARWVGGTQQTVSGVVWRGGEGTKWRVDEEEGREWREEERDWR